MSRILKVSENDYRLKVQDYGTITLDTGNEVGTVVITGNLDVKGTTTTVESTNTTVKDNIIQLNYGQTGNGISAGLNYRSGIQIDRGNYADAEFLFDEQITHWNPLISDNVYGSFVVKTDEGTLSALQLSTIVSSGTTDLIIDLQNSSNIFAYRNVNATNYANILLQSDQVYDNAIPNKKFITAYITSGVITPGMADVDKIYKSIGGDVKTKVQAYSTTIDFTVDNNLKTRISSGGVDINNINIYGDTIKNSSATQLILTANNNLVEVNAVMALDNQLSTPSASAGNTKIYSSATLGPGKSGLFFTSLNYADELVAKNRALLFSMLF